MVSGSDAHGTPVTLTAEQRGVTPEQVYESYQAEFLDNWERFGITFDLFTTTHTENHQEVAQDIFSRLYERGHIYKSTMEMPYCDADDRFLADRYVEGVCPHCDFDGARGDQCDNCGRTLDPRDLKSITCRICGSTPEFAETEHFFLKLVGFRGHAAGVVAQAGTLEVERQELHHRIPGGRPPRPRHHAGHRLGRPSAAGGLRRQAHLRLVRGGHRLPVRLHRVGQEPGRAGPLGGLLEGRKPLVLLHGQGQHTLPHHHLARPAPRIRRPQPALRRARERVHEPRGLQALHQPQLGHLAAGVSGPLRPRPAALRDSRRYAGDERLRLLVARVRAGATTTSWWPPTATSSTAC